MFTVCLALSIGASRPDFRKWGIETLELAQSELLIDGRGLYAEESRPGEPPRNVAFTWSVGVMMQALDAAAQTDRAFRPRLERYLDATGSYWNTTGPVAGYDVLPGPKPMDRYYDDNEWMVLALADASRILKSAAPLERAKAAFRYVMSGEDSVLGGGIYWKESQKTSKNTCSNAPAAAASLALFELTGDRDYLDIAERLYDWTKAHLRDPSDGLYWDNVSLDGRIQKWKFSYNTGLMLRDAAELYRFTKRSNYAADAREMQAASLTHWTDRYGSFTDDVKFMQLLLSNWLLAYRLVPDIKDPRATIEMGLTRLHDVSRDSLGHYGNKCNDVPTGGPYSPFKLIDQAAAAQMYLRAAMN